MRCLGNVEVNLQEGLGVNCQATWPHSQEYPQITLPKLSQSPGSFQLLLLPNKSPQNVVAEKYPFCFAHSFAGQEFRKGSWGGVLT